jgi:phage gp29-like protein
MPRITNNQIVMLPDDRSLVDEQSPGITPATYTTLFNQAIRDGDTTKLFKFFEEIAEKDSDINHALNTRTSQITSKEWTILNEDGEEDERSEKLLKALKKITGDPRRGLLSIQQLIKAFLDVAYLTGISVNEIVTDQSGIVGFNHIPMHLLTFYNRTTYPGLWTAEKQQGIDFNPDKMIVHYLTNGTDPARGWLGNAVSWQYVLKRTALEERLRYQSKYGKGFLLTTMPAEKDSFEEAWATAAELIENLDNVNGVVFPNGVEAQFVEASKLDGSYFFVADQDCKQNIVKIILGQESTASSQDSNRSTADVHKDILETRVVEDIEFIQNTLNTQLLPKLKPLLGISDEDIYEFKFVMGELEATMDDEMDTEEVNDGNSQSISQESE